MTQANSTNNRKRMIPTGRTLGLTFIVALTLGLIVVPMQIARQNLGEPALFTGWGLLTILLMLGLFNSRKRIPVIPLFSARAWFLFHIVFGVLALLIFWLHTNSLWPNGGYERFLAGLFYLTSISGILGFLLQKLAPRRLSNIREEFIFERVPMELSQMREQVEALTLEASKTTRSDTLGRFYVESLAWYFEKPRFMFAYAMGRNPGQVWLLKQTSALTRYVGDEERSFLDKIHQIGMRKARMDNHYAVQGSLKVWLFFHIPLATATILLALWHTLLVNVYSL